MKKLKKQVRGTFTFDKGIVSVTDPCYSDDVFQIGIHIQEISSHPRCQCHRQENDKHEHYQTAQYCQCDQ